MKNLMKVINRDIQRAKTIFIKAHGSRPTLCKEIGVGTHWMNAFIQDRVEDPSYSKIVRILDYMEKQKNQ